MSRLYDRVRFTLKKPAPGVRATYSIMRDVLYADGSRAQSALKDTRIDALNALLLAGIKKPAVAEIEARNIIKGLREAEEKLRGETTFSEENQRLFEALWKAEYVNKHVLPDSLRAARNDLQRAIASLGKHSLVSTPQEKLETIVNAKFKGTAQRRIAQNLNHLLKFAGSKVRVRLAPKSRVRVKYLSPPEFERVVTNLKPESESIRKADLELVPTVIRGLFGTGCRLGEFFAIQPEDLRKDVLYVREQMDGELELRETKTRRERHAVVMEEFLEDVARWAEVPMKTRERIRLFDFAAVVRAACVRVFPEREQKQLVARDLRHCYAIWLLNQGVSLSLVAQALGNSEAVCQEYYSGFVLTPDGIDAIKAQLARARDRR